MTLFVYISHQKAAYMTLHTNVRNQLLTNLQAVNPNELAQLNDALRLLSKWRSVLIQNTLLQQQGTVVMQGPLAGLDFIFPLCLARHS
jgi:hypothetical protein